MFEGDGSNHWGRTIEVGQLVIAPVLPGNAQPNIAAGARVTKVTPVRTISAAEGIVWTVKVEIDTPCKTISGNRLPKGAGVVFRTDTIVLGKTDKRLSVGQPIFGGDAVPTGAVVASYTGSPGQAALEVLASHATVDRTVEAGSIELELITTTGAVLDGVPRVENRVVVGQLVSVVGGGSGQIPAGTFVTKLNGNVITLSKPITADMPSTSLQFSGTTVRIKDGATNDAVGVWYGLHSTDLVFDPLVKVVVLGAANHLIKPGQPVSGAGIRPGTTVVSGRKRALFIREALSVRACADYTWRVQHALLHDILHALRDT